MRNGNTVRHEATALDKYEENLAEYVQEARIESAYEYAQTPVVKP